MLSVFASPSNFNSTNANANEWNVNPTGLMNNNNVTNGNGLRAVINLKPDTLISSGDGSVSNVFVIN